MTTLDASILLKRLANGGDIVTRVTETDRIYRSPERQNDDSLIVALVSRKILIKHSELAFDFPTIMSDCGHSWLCSQQPVYFIGKFFEKYPHLQGMHFDNVLIAGGAVSGIFTNTWSKDVDMFIYGLNQEDTMKKARYICEFLENKFKDDQCQKFIVVRTQHTITVCGKYQIICGRAYESKQQILRGFDLGSCAIGFDGYKVLFTELGLFAHVYGYNIVDVTRCSETYEERLMKYHQRGFGIILPHLNAATLEVKKDIILANLN